MAKAHFGGGTRTVPMTARDTPTTDISYDRPFKSLINPNEGLHDFIKFLMLDYCDITPFIFPFSHLAIWHYFDSDHLFIYLLILSLNFYEGSRYITGN